MNISRKTQLIIGIVFAVIMLGTGGYLLWRTNQTDTVAPTDSDAASSDFFEKCEYGSCGGSGSQKCCYDGEYIEDGEKKYLRCVCENARETGDSEDGDRTCGESCTSGNQCLTNYCYQGSCRNKACPNKSGCQCDSGDSKDTLLACGANNCTKDADCEGYTEGTHECDEVTSGDTSKQYCVRLTCPEGQELADDRCTCVDSPTCGDGTCDEDETSATCPADCEATCGNDICDTDENADTCPNDCDAECGDGYCTHDETSSTCAQDCATTQPQAGIFDDVSDSIKLGLGFISLGFITTQVNKVAMAYDVAVGNREIKIRRKRREKFEKNI